MPSSCDYDFTCSCVLIGSCIHLYYPEPIIDYIYSDSRGEDFYPTMKRELATRAIESMVVMRTDEGNPDTLAAQYTLESLKRGLNGYPNLRKKYHRPEHRVNDETFVDWQEKSLKTMSLTRSRLG